MYGHKDLLGHLKTSFESQEKELFRLLDESEHILVMLKHSLWSLRRQLLRQLRQRKLPLEVFDVILDNLAPKDITQVSFVCIAWKYYVCQYWKRKLTLVMRKCNRLPNMVEMDTLLDEHPVEYNLSHCIANLKQVRYAARWFLSKTL